MTTVGLSGLDARFVVQTAWPTPRDPATFMRALSRTVAEFRAAHPQMVCEGIGVSLPGRVDAAGNLMFAPNLGWPRVNLRREIQSAVDLPVVLENAANACALAELWFGRHPEHVRHLLAVTVRRVSASVCLEQANRSRRRRDGGKFATGLDENGPPCPWKERVLGRTRRTRPPRFYLAGGTSRANRRACRFDQVLRRAQAGEPRAAGYREAARIWGGTGVARDRAGAGSHRDRQRNHRGLGSSRTHVADAPWRGRCRREASCRPTSPCSLGCAARSHSSFSSISARQTWRRHVGERSSRIPGQASICCCSEQYEEGASMFHKTPADIRRGRLRTIVTVVSALALATSAAAQVLYGSLTGTIADSTGGVLPGVQVTALNVATGVSADETTDARGVYQFSNLQPGTYRVTVSLSDFKKVVQENVRVESLARPLADAAPAIGGRKTSWWWRTPILQPIRVGPHHTAW
jgi:hypothetical protein